MIQSICAISAGAVIGAVSRWLLGLGLNSFFPTIPLGTLLANLIGAYLVGFAIVFLINQTQVSPLWTLFVITGFLGSLTTFSTFSAEVITLVQQQRFAWALGAILLHLLGSLLMTSAGFATGYFLKR